MANSLEIIERNIVEFTDVQDIMQTAKKEHAEETYLKLKKKYRNLKTVLQAAGVNMDELDIIKE